MSKYILKKTGQKIRQQIRKELELSILDRVNFHIDKKIKETIEQLKDEKIKLKKEAKNDD